MPLIDQVQQEMVAAMKARDEARLSTLRMIKAALHKHSVDSMKPLDDAAEMQILKSLEAGSSSEMLSTHPLPESRIEKINEELAKAYPSGVLENLSSGGPLPAPPYREVSLKRDRSSLDIAA